MKKNDYLAMIVAVLVGATATLLTGNALFGVVAGMAVNVIYGVAAVAYQSGELAATDRVNVLLSLDTPRPVVDPLREETGHAQTSSS